MKSEILTSLLFLQLQPDRHPALRVIREALREAPDRGGGDVWLCSGVSKCPVQPASNGSKPTKQPQPSLSPPSPSPGQTDWCLLTDFSISWKLQRRGATTQGQNSQRLMIPHNVIRELFHITTISYREIWSAFILFLRNPVRIVFVTEARVDSVWLWREYVCAAVRRASLSLRSTWSRAHVLV